MWLQNFLRPKLSEDLCIRLLDYTKDAADGEDDVRNKKPTRKEENVTRMVFEVSVGHMMKGSSEQKAKLLMKLVPDAKIKALKPVGSIRANLILAMYLRRYRNHNVDRSWMGFRMV